MTFLSNLFGGKRTSSAEVAKERLLTVLVHDRVKLTPEAMESLKRELSEVIQRYVSDVTPGEIEVSLMRGNPNDPDDRLKADIPLRRTSLD